jgi:hypothetical protein
VTGPLARAAELFVAPDVEAAPATVSVPSEARVVVVGSREHAWPLAAALALTLRAADRSPAALVATWAAGEEHVAPPRPALRGAHRLATQLSARGLPASPRGRLAWVRLPVDPPDAAAVVRRAAAIVDGPMVTALTGPRPAGLEELVAEHDLVVLAADPDTPLARAAIAGLSHRCVSALACRPLRPGIARALALAGLAAPRLDPPLRAKAGESYTDHG